MVNDRNKYIIFNGKKSSDFDVWASGLNIFNSPKKNIERISVPGRNGELIIEDGSYENVELEFKDCFIPRDFSQNFTNFSNYLNRQKGYKRLELSWLPDEYRMATFHDGIEATMKNWDGKGKFDLTFNCKPQRFLKIGEEPVVLMNWADCSTNAESSTTYYGKSSANIGITGGTGYSVNFVKTDDNAQDITFYRSYWRTATPGEYEDPAERLQTLSNTVSSSQKIVNSQGFAVAEWMTLQFITESDDSLAGWDISIDFTDDDGNSIHGIFADSVDLINPTGFTTNPLIVSKCPNDYTWAMFYPGISFSFENEDGDFVEKYKLTVENNTTSESSHGSRVFLDCENQYIYCREADSTTETGYKLYPYTAIEMVDSATGQWQDMTFPALTDKVTRISYPSDEARGTAYSITDTQPYELIADGDMYKAIYPRWYTI